MENWRNVPGYSAYQVSDKGRVKSMKKGSRILKQPTGGGRYRVVNMYDNEGKRKTIRVHILVAEAFLGHTSCGYRLVVDHIDSNPLNNELRNLRLLTHRENVTRGNTGEGRMVGAHWNVLAGKWRSSIRLNGKSIHLGTFNSEHDAHISYMDALNSMNA